MNRRAVWRYPCLQFSILLSGAVVVGASPKFPGHSSFLPKASSCKCLQINRALARRVTHMGQTACVGGVNTPRHSPQWIRDGSWWGKGPASSAFRQDLSQVCCSHHPESPTRLGPHMVKRLMWWTTYIPTFCSVSIRGTHPETVPVSVCGWPQMRARGY